MTRDTRGMGTLRALMAGVAAVAMGASGTAAQSPGVPPVTGTWFDGLAAGVCFDNTIAADGSFDFSMPAAVVACDGPHDHEVVARVGLGDGAFPGQGVDAQATEACAGAYAAFLGRPIEATAVFPFTIWPDATDWATGAHDALCIVTAGEPILGTAASGRLTAPGETLAVYRQVDDTADVWLVDAGTGEALRAVTDDDAVRTLTAPRWTPDGTTLAYPVQVAEGDADGYMIPVAGGTPELLLDGPGKQEGYDFSPDGTSVIYSSTEGGGPSDIFVRDLTTGAVTQLTDDPAQDASPQWSPDGTRILFRRAGEGTSDLFLMGIDGSDPVRLTDNGAGNYDPRWSPDGTRILFTTNLGGDYDIWVMDADGTDQRPLTDHPADDEYPTWSSDGEYVAFHSTRHGGITLWLMRADGSEPSELTGLVPVGYPMFKPAPKG